MAKTFPSAIDKFLGLNIDDTGETQLKLGESPYMINWDITDNFKLRRREGYKQIFTPLNQSVRGMWYGKINHVYHFLFACNARIYEHNLETHVNTQIGVLADAKTYFFAYSNKVYILNGSQYKYWDGTTFGDVVGYRPKVYIGTPPTGGGDAFEQVNLLNGMKHQTFSPTSGAVEFKLLEDHIDSIDFVKVNGTATTAYTSDLTNGKVTLTTAPGVGQDTVDVGWTKGSGNRTIIEKMRKALIYGGSNKSRVHVWGNPDYQNRIYYSGFQNAASGTLYIAEPSAEYFPENNYSEIGSPENAVTDMIQQYDRALVFTEADTYYTYYDAEKIDGNTITLMPVVALNSEIGNEAFGQAQLILNSPYVLYKGVYKWVNTNIKDERDAVFVSKRIQQDLEEVDLSTAITFDNNVNHYWIIINKTVWIYNYVIDCWYKYVLNDAPTCIIQIDKDIYFGTANGTIMQFGGTRTDNGIEYMSEWQMSFYDFSVEYIIKYINRCWVSLQPSGKSKLDLFWETDKASYKNDILDFGHLDFDNLTFETNPAPVTISYNLFDYGSIDYANWTYSTVSNPQPFRVKLKAKKFTYFKLILKNNYLYEGATVLSINFKTRFGGETK